MTTTTTQKTKTSTATKQASRGEGSRKLLASLRTGVPAALEMAVVRVLTGVAIVVLLVVTAFGLIPELGAYMNAQAAVALGASPSLTAIIGIWVTPFAFVVAMLFALELWMIRRVWALGSRRVATIRRRLADPESSQAGSRSAGANKKRKK